MKGQCAFILSIPFQNISVCHFDMVDIDLISETPDIVKIHLMSLQLNKTNTSATKVPSLDLNG